MIAMALACDPRLLIADEPTTALDVMVQAQILDLLQDLVRERGLGLVIISHDLSVLADRCDRVAVMYAGRVVEGGAAREVFSRPRHPYSAGLSEAFPTIGEASSRYRPARAGRGPARPRRRCRGCAFHPRCARAEEDCRSGDVLLRDLGGRDVGLPAIPSSRRPGRPRDHRRPHPRAPSGHRREPRLRPCSVSPRACT